MNHEYDYQPIVLQLRDHRDRLREQLGRLAPASDDAIELAGLAGDLDKAMQLIGSGNTERSEVRERLKKWKAIIPKCREALDRVNELDRQIDRVAEAALLARNGAAIAENRLGNAQANPPQPSSYPTPAELAAYSQLVKQLEGELAEASANCREKVGAEGRLRGQLLAARKVFGTLEAEERHLRPRAQAAPSWSMGQLSAVR